MNSDFNYDEYTLPYKVESIMEYRRWTKEIPCLSFPSDWNIKMTPPFGCAVVRFQVYKDDAHVSVYLDCYDRLGCVGQPYWEIYPYEEDVFRCYMPETDELIGAITKSLNDQLLNRTQNAPVSDTTKADSSNSPDKTKI